MTGVTAHYPDRVMYDLCFERKFITGKPMFEISIFFAILASIFFYAIHVFNFSLQLKQRVDEQKNNLASYLQRIGKIFQSITEQLDQGGAYEENLLLGITRDREGRSPKLNDLQSNISNISARLESYPNLSSVSMRKEFQGQIQQIEQNVQYIVEAHNSAAKDYNTFVLSFPASLFCSCFNRTKIDYLSSTPL